MYNLFISALPETWDGDPWTIEIGRCVREYTATTITEQFGSLGPEAVSALKRLPCIFGYEWRLGLSPKFGVIREVTVRQGKVRIEYEIREQYPFLSAENMSELGFELDIGKYELNRTHWAVKDVDLAKELHEPVK